MVGWWIYIFLSNQNNKIFFVFDDWCKEMEIMKSWPHIKENNFTYFMI